MVLLVMLTGAALCGIISIASIKDQVEEDEVKVRCNNKGIKDNVEVLCQTAGERCCEKWKMRCVTPSSGDVFGIRHESFLHQCRDATTRSSGFLFVAGTSLCASFWEVVSHCWHTQSSCVRLASE